MDFLTALTSFNQATWLLIAGIVLLFVNIIYGWVRSARGSVKAGWFTVCLALVACIMIGVGTVQAASASATAARAGQFAGRGGGFNNQANTNVAGRNNANATSTASTVPVSNDNSAANQASTPDSTNATPQPAGTPGRGNRSNRGQGAGQGAGAVFSGNTTATPQQTGTPGPQGNRGAPGGTNTFSGGQRGSNAAGGTQSTAAQPNQMGLQLAVIGGIAGLLLALILYFRERRLTGFALANSRGLLNLGAAFFIVVAALVIPLISAQNTAAASAGRAVAAGNFRSRAVTPTPSNTPQPTDTATMMPSLTPARTDTVAPLPTQVHYSSTYTVNMEKSVCTATANTTISLRTDPSVQQQAIGRVVGGSLLNVIERSADGQWLHVITSDTGVEGWVSASFVTLGSSCQSIPGASQSSPPATPGKVTATPASAQVASSAPCTLLTTTAASLRPDPSLTHSPLASIPEKTVLTPLAKSANGSWWQVQYGNLQGWIGAGTVFSSSSCAGVPTATAVP